MQPTTLLFIASAIMLSAAALSLFFDRLTPRKHSIRAFIRNIRNAPLDRNNLLLLLSLIGTAIIALFYRTCIKDGIPIHPLIFEVTIILVVIGFSSVLFNNYEVVKGKDDKTFIQINSIGVLHLVLMAIACGALALIYYSGMDRLDDSFGNIVDIVAHAVTFSVALFGVLGNTYDDQSRSLTSQGMASVILIIVFSAISIVTSLESSAKQEALENKITDLNGKAELLIYNLDAADEQVHKILKTSEDIGTKLPSIQTAVATTLAPVIQAVNYNLDRKPGTKNGYLTKKLDDFHQQIFVADTAFKFSVGVLQKGEKAIAQNAIFISDQERVMKNIQDRFKVMADSMYEAESRRINQALMNTEEIAKTYQKQLNGINKMYWLRKEIVDVLEKRDTANLNSTIHEIQAIVKKYY